MTTQNTEDRADAELRALVAQADPEAGHSTTTPSHLLDRVRASALSEESSDVEPDTNPQVVVIDRQPSFLHRHWQGMLMAAASVLTLALASTAVLPGLAGGGSDDSSATAGVAEPAAAAADSAAAGSADGDYALSDQAGREAALSGVPSQDEAKNTMVRSASLLVGTDDVKAARDAFVAKVLADGGQITSETVTTAGEDGAEPLGGVASDMGVSYPYPYPSGPGIWLTVEVPEAKYDETVAAARELGTVVQMQQSAYDVGQQVTDVDARIAVLEASLARLEGLMDDAEGVSEVVKVENAITERQAELDSLRAQQRDLTNQTSMSQISLTLMSPEDATQSVNPNPPKTWWESFVAGLSQFWSWFGTALLILSPLLIAAAIIWAVRRRQRRRGATSATRAPEGPAPDEPQG